MRPQIIMIYLSFIFFQIMLAGLGIFIYTQDQEPGSPDWSDLPFWKPEYSDNPVMLILIAGTVMAVAAYFLFPRILGTVDRVSGAMDSAQTNLGSSSGKTPQQSQFVIAILRGVSAEFCGLMGFVGGFLFLNPMLPLPFIGLGILLLLLAFPRS